MVISFESELRLVSFLSHLKDNLELYNFFVNEFFSLNFIIKKNGHKVGTMQSRWNLISLGSITNNLSSRAPFDLKIEP